ncbi:MAG: hypothetical protein Q9174_003456 [Haloplaca sp. 1 TL-2023]
MVRTINDSLTIFTVYFKFCDPDDEHSSLSNAAIQMYLQPDWTLYEVQDTGRELRERITDLGVSRFEDEHAARFANEMKSLAQKMDTWCFELTAAVRPSLMDELYEESGHICS